MSLKLLCPPNIDKVYVIYAPKRIVNGSLKQVDL